MAGRYEGEQTCEAPQKGATTNDGRIDEHRDREATRLERRRAGEPVGCTNAIDVYAVREVARQHQSRSSTQAHRQRDAQEATARRRD